MSEKSVTWGSYLTVFASVVVMSFFSNLAVATVQVFNYDYWMTPQIGDVNPDRPGAKRLVPISMVGARNGVCSGYVVVGSDVPIKGLTAKVSNLKSGTATIVSENIAVRFSKQSSKKDCWLQSQRFDMLLDKAPLEVAVKDPGAIRRYEPKSTVPIAMQPIWVTIRIPATATPGEYYGVLSIKAAGLPEKQQSVPIKLTVCNWLMPDTKDFRVRTLGWMSPEALAKSYKAELWSDRHFALMGQSMEQMLELGSRQIIINVSKQYPAQDNDDTMIKWIKQPDGSYQYDFTVFDNYCDLVAKKIGNPFPVRINMWRGPKNGGGGEKDDYPNSTVLVYDPVTKVTTELLAPTKLGSPEMLKFWKPVMDKIKERLVKRGWWDATGCDWMCYCGGMTTEMIDMVHSIWPDGKWTEVTHAPPKYHKGSGELQMPIIACS
ncbi:MAG: hypothetical protein KAI74_06890, partial [Kiritimatiellae bacterium]|nr:hypothetical protein [Kiritimatiellia bacterium]